MKTIESSWVDCSEYWYNDVNTRNINPLYDAFKEAESAIDTVANAGDIGSLSISLTFNDLEEINEKRRKFVSFCNAIHYEISKLVDNPFSVSVADILQAAYDLNPSDFKVKTGKTLWWDNMTSLKDLVLSTITDKNLKKDFESKINTLDKDKPSATLQDSIKEARFWKDEFEKSEECKKIAQEVFSPDVRANWDKLTEVERKAIIEDYVNRIGKVLFGKDKTSVQYSADGYGFSQSGFLGIGRKISINPQFVSDPKGNYSIDKIIDTLTHEMKHQEQSRVSGVPNSVKNQWNAPYPNSQKDYQNYYRHGKERNSRGFAALSKPF
jgi:hypothetical protein